jgi:beta-lactamase superfamily II metal-dependent hydrolase
LQSWDWGSVHATVLNPDGHRTGAADKSADESLVLELDYFNWGVLLAGDIHEAGERRAIAAGVGLQHPIQVLKVADHGSAKGSSERFLGAVFQGAGTTPQPLAVVTNGSFDWSPRVADEVRRRLETQHVQIVNTAEQGTITVIVDPDSGPRYVSAY